jgi:hypothetical protein
MKRIAKHKKKLWNVKLLRKSLKMNVKLIVLLIGKKSLDKLL